MAAQQQWRTPEDWTAEKTRILLMSRPMNAMAIHDGAKEVLTFINKFLSTVSEMQGDALAGGIKQTRVLMSSNVLKKLAVKVQ